jgi:exodeoxyribonuclease V gamma subunit
VLRAGGTLPLGALGRGAFDGIAPGAAALARAARDARGGERLAREEIDLTIDGVRVTGALRELWPGGQIAVQYSRLGGRHELALWIRHLARQAARATGAPSVLIGRAEKGDQQAQVWFSPADQPLPLLAELLRLFRLGQRAPLPFLTRASRAFTKALAEPKGTSEGVWVAARKAFGPDDFSVSDLIDPYVAELYPDGPPFGGAAAALPAEISFADAARAVFEPLFRHRTLRP